MPPPYIFDPLVTPWDGTGAYGGRGVRIPGSGRIIVGGNSGPGSTEILISDDDGASWTAVSTPFSGGYVGELAWSDPLGVLVAVGRGGGGAFPTVAYSTDEGDTWNDAGDPFRTGGFSLTNGNCVAWDDGEALFVAGGFSATGRCIVTSPDGIVWTAQTNPFGAGGFVAGIIFALGQWIAVGADAGPTISAATATSGATVWTAVTSGPFDGQYGQDITFDSVSGNLVACGYFGGAISTSPDAAAWTPRASDLDAGTAYVAEALSGTIVVGGNSPTGALITSIDGGLTWATNATPLDDNTCFGVVFIGDDDHVLLSGQNLSGSTVLALSGGTPPPPPPPPPTGRVQIAFNDATLEPSPTWTTLDDTDSLVASYTIDRGRQFERDRTDGARATVAINDVDGLLDPTNTTGPYYGLIEPLLQIRLRRWNPVLLEWQTRFRGFIADYSYDTDPSQVVNRLTIDCVDLFEILNAIEMLPGEFGDTPPPVSDGQVFFDNNQVGGGSGRIDQVMGNAGIDVAFYVAFSGNVLLYEAVYSVGESPMTVIQEASDAEFPGVSNVYTDRFGRLVFHGRLAKFDPATTAAVAGDAVWDWHHWHCGDGAAVLSAPSVTAQIREFSFDRGLSQIINSAIATPLNIADSDVDGQKVTDATSIGRFGIRSWSAQNLLTKEGLLDSSDALTETRRFSLWRVDNYKEPRNRVTALSFRSIDPASPGAAATWKLMCEADISDEIGITVSLPGGGGFNDEDFFIEGIHEENRPLGPLFDDVTVRLDVSPASLYVDAEGRFPTS